MSAPQPTARELLDEHAHFKSLDLRSPISSYDLLAARVEAVISECEEARQHLRPVAPERVLRLLNGENP